MQLLILCFYVGIYGIPLSLLMVLCVQDIVYLKISRRLLAVFTFSTFGAIMYNGHYSDLICSIILATIVYTLGWKLGHIGIGDLKVVPALSALAVTGFSQITLDKGVLSKEFLGLLFPGDCTILNQIYYCRLTLLWIILAQVITVCAVVLRKMIFNTYIRRPIAHYPYMCLAIVLVFCLQTWNVI